MKKFFKHKIKSFLLVNKVVVIHYLEPKKRFYFPTEKHDFWEIMCAVKGKASCTADEKIITLNEGEIFFHKPNESHSLTVDDYENAGVFVMSFECGSESMRFFSDRKIKLSNRQMKYIKEIIEIAKRTYDITFYDLETDIMHLLPHPTLGGEQLIKNYLETLLIDVMRSMTETEDGNAVFLQETEINNKLAEEIIKILKANLNNRLTIEDISKAINYSKAYVFRQFKAATNKSVMEYYLELKIKRSKELLEENTLSIREISEQLCFDTPNYFSKTFKKLIGITPTEYKKRVQA